MEIKSSKKKDFLVRRPTDSAYSGLNLDSGLGYTPLEGAGSHFGSNLYKGFLNNG